MEHVEITVHNGTSKADLAAFVIEYDLADAIYAACLAESWERESAFYFMDDEDGGSSLRMVLPHKRKKVAPARLSFAASLA